MEGREPGPDRGAAVRIAAAGGKLIDLPYDRNMPCDAELDLERRWVRARAWGVVTYDDVLAARRKFMADPNFKPDFRRYTMDVM